MHQLARPILNGQTYRSGVFIATRPLVGIVYATVVVAGFATGLSASPFIVGIPVIALTFATAWGFAAFERQLARWWLRADVPPMSVPRPAGRRLWKRARDHLASAITWKSILYLVVQLPAGVIAFALEVAGVSAGLAMLLSPLWYLLDRLTYRPGGSGTSFTGPVLWLTGTGPGIEPLGLLISL